MHPSVFAWVRRNVPPLRAGQRVLEVGSLDVNGTPRDAFPDEVEYIGLDKRAGLGVDEVGDIEDYTDRAPTWSWPFFDVVVSTEMLEHTPRPWRALEAMFRLSARGSLLLLTTRGPGFGPHDHGGDFYRFTEDAMRVLCKDAGFESVETCPDPDPGSPGVFVKARA